VFFVCQTSIEQKHIGDALGFELSKVERPDIRSHTVSPLINIDAKLAARWNIDSWVVSGVRCPRHAPFAHGLNHRLELSTPSGERRWGRQLFGLGSNLCGKGQNGGQRDYGPFLPHGPR
jgi:hypothetical protein